MENWKDVTGSKLRELYYDQQLSDNDIAELYGVSRTSVANKRKKYSITSDSKNYYYALKNSPELSIANNIAKERLLDPKNINKIAKALTLHLFRYGVVEDFHNQKKLSDEDMKKLNIFFANRLAGLLTAAYRGSWIQLEAICARQLMYTNGWLEPEPDMESIEAINDIIFNTNRVFPIQI